MRPRRARGRQGDRRRVSRLDGSRRDRKKRTSARQRSGGDDAQHMPNFGFAGADGIVARERAAPREDGGRARSDGTRVSDRAGDGRRHGLVSTGVTMAELRDEVELHCGSRSRRLVRDAHLHGMEEQSLDSGSEPRMPDSERHGGDLRLRRVVTATARTSPYRRRRRAERGVPGLRHDCSRPAVA